MISASLRRLIPVLSVIVLGGGAISCSSTSKSGDFGPSANPVEEAAKLDSDMESGFSDHYDVLAPDDFTKAQQLLAKGKREMASGDKSDRILDTLARSKASLLSAKTQAEALREPMRSLLDARASALKAGVRNFPNTSEGLRIQDEKVRADLDNIERGKLSSSKWADLQKGYLDLELRGIQSTKLSDVRAKVDSAVANGAKRNTPRLLARTQRELVAAEGVIAGDRHNDQTIQPAVENADEMATLLTDVLAATKRSNGAVINEEAALSLVKQGRSLHALKEKLGVVSATERQQRDELSKQSEEIKSAKESMSLNNALEAARRRFSSSEADVYRQGDKLLIRLKAMKFSVGRSDLPPESLDLLAKVKSTAEDLNPGQIIVEGHTDSTGSKATNMKLSQNRADAVASYLESNGFDSDKIQAIGYGYKKPLVANKTASERAFNRRVDIIISPNSKTESSVER